MNTKNTMLKNDRTKQIKPAAVLVPLIFREDETSVLFTKRSKNLPYHAGEVCFPGGGYHENDLCLEKTAKREAFEEIGLSEKRIQILGELPALESLSGFLVHPFVAQILPPETYELSDQEVDSIFEVPLSYTMNKKNFLKNTQLSLEYKDNLIWGLTAQILINLSEFLTYQLDLSSISEKPLLAT